MMDDDLEGNVNYFKLDKEFQGCESCSLFELYAILKDKITKKGGSEQEMNSVLSKTKQYAERFNKYGFPETTEKTSTKALDLRQILNTPQKKFTPAETAQLLDLLPQNASEAFALIPSLRAKLTESDMQNYLDQLQKMASSGPLDN